MRSKLSGFLAVLCLGLMGATSNAAVVRDDNPTLGKGLVTPVRQWSDSSVTPKAAVLLLHGFPEHGLLYDKLATQLAEKGYVVYAPDMRGLGRAYSSGSATRIDYVSSADDDVALVAKRIRKAHKDIPLFVGGESMGGALSIRLAAKHPDLVDGVILSGPALILERHYARLIPRGLLTVATLGLAKVDFSKQISNFFSTDRRIAKELLDDPLVRKKFGVLELTETRKFPEDTKNYVRKIPANIPVLVLQSCDDRQTNPETLNLLNSRLRSADVTFVIRQSGGHTILQTSYIEKSDSDSVINWLNDCLKKIDSVSK